MIVADYNGEVRRQATTVAVIEIISTIASKNLSDKPIKKIIIIDSSGNSQTKAHSLDELPVTTIQQKIFYYELFQRTGNESQCLFRL